MMLKLSNQDKREMLQLVRKTIEVYLKEGLIRKPANVPSAWQEKRGVFVTLHEKGELRGCIGYPLPVKPLAEALVDNAVAAASEDPRFEPVGEEELANIDIEISVLTEPQIVSGPDKVEVGRDGIIISKGVRRGLLLPQVPLEQGWDRDEFISYGCLKAGLARDEWHRGVQIETFQAIVFGERNLEE